MLAYVTIFFHAIRASKRDPAFMTVWRVIRIVYWMNKKTNPRIILYWDQDVKVKGSKNIMFKMNEKIGMLDMFTEWTDQVFSLYTKIIVLRIVDSTVRKSKLMTQTPIV